MLGCIHTHYSINVSKSKVFFENISRCIAKKFFGKDKLRYGTLCRDGKRRAGAFPRSAAPRA